MCIIHAALSHTRTGSASVKKPFRMRCDVEMGMNIRQAKSQAAIINAWASDVKRTFAASNCFVISSRDEPHANGKDTTRAITSDTNIFMKEQKNLSCVR
jgi:hypothetical protein